jgi:hypothetical protein
LDLPLAWLQGSSVVICLRKLQFPNEFQEVGAPYQQMLQLYHCGNLGKDIFNKPLYVDFAAREFCFWHNPNWLTKVLKG